jgi:Flp pilus assembly protein TadB
MEVMRSTWTDSRLDEFKDQVNKSLNDLGQRMDHQSDRIDRLQHTILVVGGGLFAAFVAVLAAIIGLIATQI